MSYQDNFEDIFSLKRYFINNLDTYHGEYILKVTSQVLKRDDLVQSSVTSQTIIGEEGGFVSPQPPKPSYEIIGTVSDPKVEKLNNVARILSKTDCLLKMLTCGYVIIDISCDTNELDITMEYIKLLKDLFENTEATDDEPVIEKRYLILISTVMTWAMTKPMDPETPDMPFVETDFRKRKPHPSYKMHFDIENEVIGLARKYKSFIGAIVVATGVTYGGREDVLFYWFQKAWECERFLPILDRGTNTIPLINVVDLSNIIYGLVTDFPKKLYILAVEQNVTKQKEIIKPLGRMVGTGMFRCIPKEDGLLIPDITQRIYDLMTLNLNMEPTFIVEAMQIEWTSELSFAENVPVLIKQFRKERRLKPFKLVIHGPPIVGKTTLTKQICEAYGLLYISPETVLQDMTEELKWRTEHWERGELATLGLVTGEEGDMELDNDEDENEEEVQEAARRDLANLQSGRFFTDEEILGYIRQRLLSHEALNRGWIIDGYPLTLLQCASLFEKGEEQEVEDEMEENPEEQFEEDVPLYDNVLKRLLPDIVVTLEATDDFIFEKAMRQPEGDYRLEEETIVRRVSEFRSGNTRDLTPLNFFDELSIHPLVVPVNDHLDYIMQGPYFEVTLRMGVPCRYGKLLALIEAAEKKKRDELEALRLKEEKAKKELEEKMKHEREDKMEYWSELYALLREEEESALAAAGEPMRNYLIHHIFPTLTPALLEIAKLRPHDPIDYLAEYLFKLNPTGKMLEPGYNLQAELILGKLKLMDDTLRDLDIKIDPLVPSNVELGETSDQILTDK